MCYQRTGNNSQCIVDPHLTAKVRTYRSVPLIRPSILYTTSSPKRGGGVFSSTQLVSIIRPLEKFCYVYDIAKVHVHSLQKYKRSPVLFVVIMRGLPTSARRSATSITFTTPSLWPSSRTAIPSVMNTEHFLVFPAEEWQRGDLYRRRQRSICMRDRDDLQSCASVG